MRYSVQFSPQFLRDLYEIEDYITYTFHDPQAAQRITDGIVNATDILADYPETGARIFLPGGLDSGYRFVIYQGYLAIYAIRPDGVYIVRAVHEKQDYMRILFPWTRTQDKD